MMASLIVLYKGRKGSGKTLTMVKDGYENYLRGFKVLRNFHASFGEYISTEEIISLNKGSELSNCIILIDEIQIFFDSRRSGRKENLEFSYFVQQVRKRNITILCTTQFSGTVDLRLRQNLDVVAMPRFYKDLNVCEVTYVDVTAFEDMFYGEILAPPQIRIVYNANPIFKLYDSYERQEGLTDEERKNLFKKEM